MLFDLPLEELKTYCPPREEPDDFDLFWYDTLAKARENPLGFRFEPVDANQWELGLPLKYLPSLLRSPGLPFFASISCSAGYSSSHWVYLLCCS